MTEYLAVLIFIFAGIGIVLFTFLLARLIRPSNPYPAKTINYECAEEPIGTSWIRFNNRFYIFALIFVIFDVEVIFLFPWAVISTRFPERTAGAIISYQHGRKHATVSFRHSVRGTCSFANVL